MSARYLLWAGDCVVVIQIIKLQAKIPTDKTSRMMSYSNRWEERSVVWRWWSAIPTNCMGLDCFWCPLLWSSLSVISNLCHCLDQMTPSSSPRWIADNRQIIYQHHDHHDHHHHHQPLVTIQKLDSWQS